ncbi:MAG: RpiB/LacA/LacB family sugar-phosphate isomerase [Phycisphaerae bacterium]|jgi:hypothetical protein
MSRPVVTAKLLDELRRAGTPIRLPKNALLTPAARDWFKDQAMPILWQEEGEPAARGAGVVLDPAQPAMRAALALVERIAGSAELIAPAAGGPGPLASAVRRLCGKVNRREVARGVVFTPDPVVPLIVANKHDGVRAVLGTCLPAVETACRELGANVLVIDATRHATHLTRQMVERLMSGPTCPPAEMAAVLEAIERSGGREDW